MPSKDAVLARVGQRNVRLTHLDKVYWPDSGLTKGDLIDYYANVADVLLSHLKDRPLSLVRYPNGTAEKGFYQKDAPAGTPDWVRLAPLWSKERGEDINFILCDNVETLVWMVNSGVVEINPCFRATTNRIIRTSRFSTSIRRRVRPGMM
jgi:bifunctional non-homologous end joining protein LigD